MFKSFKIQCIQQCKETRILNSCIFSLDKNKLPSGLVSFIQSANNNTFPLANATDCFMEIYV